MTPTWEFEGLKFWSIGYSKSSRLYEKVERRMSKDSTWQFDLSGPPERIGEELIVFGNSFDRLVGYMYIDTVHGKEISTASRIFNTAVEMRSEKGREVNAANLSTFPGYDKFGGSKPVCCLSMIEVEMSQHRRKGFGSIALRFLQSREFELIELSSTRTAKKFYLKNGFVDTTIDVGIAQRDVLVWANSKFQVLEE